MGDVTKRNKVLHVAALLCLFIFLLMNGRAVASGNIKISIDEIHFPDANFRAFCQSKWGNELSSAEISATLTMDISGKAIEDLTGIHYFTSLQELNCGNNQIEHLDVSANTELIHLNCEDNRLTSIDLSNNEQLLVFNCWNNQLTQLNTKNNRNLTHLHCDANQLHSLDVSHLTHLSELSISKGDNNIPHLDLSNNLQLKKLNCSHNPLTTLDLSNNTSLTYLECYGTNISELDLQSNAQLQSLVIGHNRISTLILPEAGSLKNIDCYDEIISELDVSKQTELNNLSVYDCMLKTLDLTNNLELTSLYVDNNPLILLDLSKNNKLTLNGDKISATELQVEVIKTASNQWELDLTKILSLSSIDHIVSISHGERNNNKVVFTSTLPQKVTLYYDLLLPLNPSARLVIDVMIVPDNDTLIVPINKTTFPDDAFRSFCQNKWGNTLTATEVNAVQKMDISNLGIVDITGLNYFVHLTELFCNGNSIRILDLSANTALQYVECNDNLLHSIDVSANPNLHYLSCMNNNLTTINVANNLKLDNFYCDNNNIKVLDLSNNVLLSVFHCENNQLQTLDLTKNTKLEVLGCKNNDLSALNLKKNPLIWYLDISFNSLPYVDLNNQHELRPHILFSNNNQITTTVHRDKNGKAYIDLNEFMPTLQNQQISSISEGEMIGNKLYFIDDFPSMLTYRYHLNLPRSLTSTMLVAVMLLPEAPIPPSTGDNMPLLLLVMICLLSFLSMAFLIKHSRKTE